MKQTNKHTLSIILLSLMIVAIGFYCVIIIAEFHTSRFGRKVNAKVIDISKLCNYRNAHVTLLIEGMQEKVRIYGRRCRTDEFPLNGQVTVRVNKQLDIIAVPGNSQIPRIIFFPFFLIALIVGLKQLLKERRKLTK